MLDIDEQLSAMVQGAIESGCLLSVQPRVISELLYQARAWKDEAEKQRAEVERLREESEQLWIKYRNAQATAERLQAVVDAADELTHVVLHRLPAVAPEDTVAVIRAADDYRELRGPSQ